MVITSPRQARSSTSFLAILCACANIAGSTCIIPNAPVCQSYISISSRYTANTSEGGIVILIFGMIDDGVVELSAASSCSLVGCTTCTISGVKALRSIPACTRPLAMNSAFCSSCHSFAQLPSRSLVIMVSTLKATVCRRLSC